MPAAMKAATAVESAAETAARYCAAAEPTAHESACNGTASHEAAAEAGPAYEARAANEATAIKAASVESTRTVEAMEPRAGTDEDAACEPVRAVLAVGRASVGVIAIVSVRADRRGTVVSWANAYTDHHSLRIRKSCA